MGYGIGLRLWVMGYGLWDRIEVRVSSCHGSYDAGTCMMQVHVCVSVWVSSCHGPDLEVC